MTPAATSGVDGVLGGRELEPGAALYLCGPAIAQQKRHRPECGHRLEALGATDYVRIRWYGRAKQHRLAYSDQLSRGLRAWQARSRHATGERIGDCDLMRSTSASCARQRWSGNASSAVRHRRGLGEKSKSRVAPCPQIDERRTRNMTDDESG